MGCLLSLMKFLLTIAFLIFIILLILYCLVGVIKLIAVVFLIIFVITTFKEDILEVTYVASFYISKKM